MTKPPKMLESSATISPCGHYRYTLERIWNDELPECVFIMLNPSTADDVDDDRTIKRCIDFANRWKCGSLFVLNLFAYRATDPFDLMLADDPVGPKNDIFFNRLELCMEDDDILVAAWGINAVKVNAARVEVVKQIIEWAPLKCLGQTKDGHPRHPVRLARDTQLIDF